MGKKAASASVAIIEMLRKIDAAAAPMIVAVIGYFFAHGSPGAWSIGDVSQPLARALPLDYASAGTIGYELLTRVKSLLRIKRMSRELTRNYELIRSQRDALVLAEEQKKELTTLVVHDLKTPLTVIAGNVDFVRKRNPRTGMSPKNGTFRVLSTD